MGVANRDYDSTEQNYEVQFNKESVSATGATIFAGVVKSPGQLRQVVVGGIGLSGTPSYAIEIHRWTSAGNTAILAGVAVTLAVATGVSGSILASGATFVANSSLAAVQVGDLLVLKSAGANTAAAQLFGSFVIKATQDIKQTMSVTV